MIRFVVFLLFSVFTLSATAQQSAIKKDTAEKKIATIGSQPTADPIMDTDESLKYMGGLLLFEVKKRLNLTSREEELQAIATKNKKVRLSIGGIVIER